MNVIRNWFADDRCHRALLKGCLHKGMPVEFLALYGKKQVARLDRSRVDAPARDRRIGGIERGLKILAYLAQRQFHSLQLLNGPARLRLAVAERAQHAP